MKNQVSGCLDPFERGVNFDPSRKDDRVDLAWASDLCKQKVRDYVIKENPCRQKFTKVDVIPLYACDPQRYYRVTLWVNNWSSESLGPVPELWKSFCVTLEGVERRIVSIVESRRPRLVIGTNGQKLMDELGLLQETVG